jgi:hypothetical protein
MLMGHKTEKSAHTFNAFGMDSGEEDTQSIIAHLFLFVSTKHFFDFDFYASLCLHIRQPQTPHHSTPVYVYYISIPLEAVHALSLVTFNILSLSAPI